MLQIFLAHAKEDKETVTALYYRLKESGYKPWLDKEDLLPGQIWKAEIPKAIRDSQVFIACLSKRSIEKEGYVQDEFKMALKACASKPVGSIYLIPLRLDDCQIPELRQEEYGTNLRDIQWLDFFEPTGFDILIKALEYAKSIGSIRTESDVPISDLFVPNQPSILPLYKPEENSRQSSKHNKQAEDSSSEAGSAVWLNINTFRNQIDKKIIARVSLFIVGIILAFLVIPLVFSIVGNSSRSEEAEGVKANGSIVYSSDPNIQKRFSSGERLLMSERICAEPKRHCGDSLNLAEQGSRAFGHAADGGNDYSKAIDSFDSSIEEYSKNPELYIYRNNAIARQAAMVEGFNGRKVILAAAVPANSNTSGRAEEMLRGIADAQSCYIGQQKDLQNNPHFNCPPKSDNVLLEVVVVDDENLPTVAEENAQAIVENIAISGVIGHYASGVTNTALRVYDSSVTAGAQAPIPVISPASTRYELRNSDNFYRTTASTKKLGRKIASYLEDNGVEAVLGLYDRQDDYSEALWIDFKEAFPQNKIVGLTAIPSDATDIINYLEKDISSKLDREISDGQKFAIVMLPPSTFDNRTISSEEQKWELVMRISEVVREKNGSGQDGFVIGGNDLYDPEVLKIDNKLSGMFFTVPWFSGFYEDNSGSYAKVTEGKWGGRVSWVTANSYDAAHVFMQALVAIDLKSSEIRQELIGRIQSVELESEYSSGEKVVFEDKEPTRNPFVLEISDKVYAENSSQYNLKIVDGPQ